MRDVLLHCEDKYCLRAGDGTSQVRRRERARARGRTPRDHRAPTVDKGTLGNGERARASAGAPTLPRSANLAWSDVCPPTRNDLDPRAARRGRVVLGPDGGFDDVVPEDANIYSNFRYAGDDTDEGRRYREAEIKAIAKTLFELRTCRPGQHAMLKGREREGKTGALFSIALAALLAHARRDPVRAKQGGSRRGHGEEDSTPGFGKYWNVSHVGQEGPGTTTTFVRYRQISSPPHRDGERLKTSSSEKRGEDIKR